MNKIWAGWILVWGIWALAAPAGAGTDSRPIPGKGSVRVALEPLPPFINKGFPDRPDPGCSVILIRKAAKKAGLSLVFTEAPYNRLKKGLETRRYDLVGHMPYKREVADFYTYAVDVDWSIGAPMDLYAMSLEKLENPAGLIIGTPRGNKDFAAEFTGIPLDRFYDTGSIESLLKMLYKGRIDGFWFPRATTMPLIRALGRKVYYRQLPDRILPIGFAVPNTLRGLALKERIEKAIQTIDVRALFKEILYFNALPAQGEIN